MNPNPSNQGFYAMGFYAMLRRAAGFALQWRLLLLWIITLAIPTLIFALPFWQMLGAQLNYSVHAQELAHHLTMNAIGDLMSVLMQNRLALQDSGLAALILTLLLVPFLNGLMLTAARAPVPPTLGKLVHGGIAEYWRMVRILLWALIPFGIAAAISAGAMHLADDYAQRAILESDAVRINHLVLGLTLLLLMLADVVVEAGRAQLVHGIPKLGAWRAGWRGLRLVVKHPLLTLGAYVLLALAGLVVAALLLLLRSQIGHAEIPGALCALLLTQLVIAALAWSKAARLHALAALATAATSPTATSAANPAGVATTASA